MWVVIVNEDSAGFPLECREYTSEEQARTDFPDHKVMTLEQYQSYKAAMDQVHGDQAPPESAPVPWWKVWA